MASPTVMMALPCPITTSLSAIFSDTLSPEASEASVPPKTSASGVRPNIGPLPARVTGTAISRPSRTTVGRPGAAGAGGCPP